jgi:hypothetical protein
MRRSAAVICSLGIFASACSVTLPSPTPTPTSAPPEPRSRGIVILDPPREDPTPTPRSSPTPAPSDPHCTHGITHVRTAAELYEGSCWGWRVGPENFDSGDIADRKIEIDCDGKLYGDSIETSGPPWEDQLSDLDINLVTVPDGTTFQHVGKWTCGSSGFSDEARIVLNPENGAEVNISRALDGGGWLVVDAVPGSVRSCTIRGLPSVCIDHVSISDYAFTIAYAFVLEDSDLDPYGVVLRLYSEDLPLDDLIQIAENVIPIPHPR